MHFWQIDAPDLGLRKSVAVHDVRVDAVVSSSHSRQLGDKFFRSGLVWMQMPEALHVRRPHKKEMHEMTVVGNEIVHLDSLRPCFFGLGTGTGGIRILQAQQQLASANDTYIASLFGHNIAKVLLARSVGNAEQLVKQYLAGDATLPPRVVAPGAQTPPAQSNNPQPPNPPQPKQ